MKCDVLKFDFTKTWILLNAGKEHNTESYLERRILNSISTHINEFEPENVKNVYGRVADILLFEKVEVIAGYKGIGESSITRIVRIREYLSGKNTYCWIFGKTIEKKSEVKQVISFGDMNDKTEQKIGKEYVITINGTVQENIFTIKGKKQYAVNLTEEEHKGIEKFFNALRSSHFESITGMGVEAL